MDSAGIGTASRSVLVRLSLIAGEHIGTSYEARTQDVLDRFKLWAGNIGALHVDDDPYSLAHRLRSAPQLKSEVQRLLDEVSDDIAELTTTFQACEHQPAQTHESPDEHDQEFDVSTILAVIAESITSLLKISGLSRRTRDRDQYAIALRRVGRDAVLSEASELETLLSVHRRLRGENLSWLGIRLAEANSQRRRFLRHREDHQLRIEAGGLQTSKLPSRSETSEVDAPGDLFTLAEGSSHYGKSAASTAADAVTSASFASDLDEDVDSIYTHETDTMGFERSRTITLQELMDEGEITEPTQGFVCRYCKNEVFCARESAWRRHIMSDLRAYVCTAKDCELRMFDDSKAWIQHELSEHHAQRGCPYCNQTFPSLEGLKEHFRGHHADAINEEHLDQLAALDTRTPSSISASACVFCDWTSKLRNQARYRDKEEVDVPLHRYRRHVGNHLEQAALAILSPLTGAPQSDNEDNLSSDSDAEDFGGSHAHSRKPPRNGTVRFSDLWNVFVPGDLVFEPGRQRVLRVVSTEGENPDLGQDPLPSSMRAQHLRRHIQTNNPKYAAGADRFTLRCMSLDFDGHELGPVLSELLVDPFPGARDVKTLPVFPVELLSEVSTAKSPNTGLDRLRSRGRKYIDLISSPKLVHTHYRGPAGIEPQRQISSHVVVDVKGYYQEAPAKAPRLETNIYGRNQMQANVNTHYRVPIQQSYIPEEHHLLLPATLPGYALDIGAWVQLHVEELANMQAREHLTYDDLVLPQHDKRLLWKITSSLAYADPPSDGGDRTSNGPGLVMLLHGGPGTGKSSTVQCLARSKDRPLLSVKCSTLGVDTSALELGLAKLFRTATRWDCIILMDEAETLFASRTVKDQDLHARRAMFTRHLQKSPGFVFLKTTIMGPLDKAFYTFHVHVTISFLPLNFTALYKIWEVTLNQCRDQMDRHEFSTIMQFVAKTCLKSTGSALEPMNGRHIQTICQAAAALAKHEGDGYLQVEHLEIVMRSSDEFEKYLGATDPVIDESELMTRSSSSLH